MVKIFVCSNGIKQKMKIISKRNKEREREKDVVNQPKLYLYLNTF